MKTQNKKDKLYHYRLNCGFGTNNFQWLETMETRINGHDKILDVLNHAFHDFLGPKKLEISEVDSDT